jgi:carbon storage regulator
MLVLSRRLGEEIVIDGSIRLTIVGLRGNQVRLGITAPKSVSVQREEIQDRYPLKVPSRRTPRLSLSRS